MCVCACLRAYTHVAVSTRLPDAEAMLTDSLKCSVIWDDVKLAQLVRARDCQS